MFTGIVEETGVVLEIEDTEGGRRLRIETTFEALATGQSISVDGACLTVESFAGGEWLSVFLDRKSVV